MVRNLILKKSKKKNSHKGSMSLGALLAVITQVEILRLGMKMKHVSASFSSTIVFTIR